MITVPILVTIIGLLVWFLSEGHGEPPRNYPKIAETGRIMFQIGMFWLVAAYASTAILTLGRG